MTRRLRLSWCVRAAAAALACAAAACAQTLAPQLDSTSLSVKAKHPVFLDGAALERLHDGATVIFTLELSILSASRGPLHTRAAGRFAVSYDLWEERFAVTRLGVSRKPEQAENREPPSGSVSSARSNSAAGTSPPPPAP